MKAESRIKSASRYCIFFDLIMKGMCLPSKPQNVILSLSPNENLIVLLKKIKKKNDVSDFRTLHLLPSYYK